MAHELHIQNGKASMMYYGDPPWHGLGTRLDKPATSAEAIKAANLDWQVTLKPLLAFDEAGTAPAKQRLAVVREDLWGQANCPVFGVVYAGYTPLQNAEAFAFFDSLVGNKTAIYHTAGALGQGERVWILAKLPDEIRVVGDDIAEKYLLLSTGHDGRTSVQLRFTPVRVVCNNTLSMALQRDAGVSVAHTPELFRGLRDAKVALGLIQRRYGEIERSFQRLAQVPMTGSRLDDYLRLVFPDPRNRDDETQLRHVLEHRQAAARHFAEGPGNDAKDVQGTLWAAYNGVTGYIDYGRPRYTGSRRLRNIWFGQGAKQKVRAHAIAQRLASTWLN
ncbi:MAG: DUF932 domain-containing protein [Planctomycetota bacterium]|nr:DUF932 domain-containing protein [Planctomycetota bacterium]